MTNISAVIGLEKAEEGGETVFKGLPIDHKTNTEWSVNLNRGDIVLFHKQVVHSGKEVKKDVNESLSSI